MRNVFFSFDYDDAWRVSQVRNCHQVGWDGLSFTRWSDWEQVRRQSDEAIRRWINDQLDGASVTVVVIGEETWKSRWVEYEIAESVRRRKGILGLHTNRMKGSDQLQGGPFPYTNPFMAHAARDYGRNHAVPSMLGVTPPARLSEQVRTYCWVHDGGRFNLVQWIETAIKDVGPPTLGGLLSNYNGR